MSIFRLKNLTGSDSQQSWAGNFTFPHNVAIDLCDPGIYGEPSISYNLGLNIQDIIGVHGGTCYEFVASLIRTGLWRLNDGDRDFTKEDALILLKYGNQPIHKHTTVLGSVSYVAFESHNLADKAVWPTPPDDNNLNGVSFFVIAPASGKLLKLVKSKMIFSPGLVCDDAIVFRIYAGNYIVSQLVYDRAEKFFLGADSITVVPSIGDPSTCGTTGLIHSIYNYPQPINLYSSLGMRLEIGFANNKPVKTASCVLKVRLEAISEDDV